MVGVPGRLAGRRGWEEGGGAGGSEGRRASEAGNAGAGRVRVPRAPRYSGRGGGSELGAHARTRRRGPAPEEAVAGRGAGPHRGPNAPCFWCCGWPGAARCPPAAARAAACSIGRCACLRRRHECERRGGGAVRGRDWGQAVDSAPGHSRVGGGGLPRVWPPRALTFAAYAYPRAGVASGGHLVPSVRQYLRPGVLSVPV